MLKCQAAEQLGRFHQKHRQCQKKNLVFCNVFHLDKAGLNGFDFRTADL